MPKTINPPYFDQADIVLEDEHALDDPDMRRAFERFMALTGVDRLADSRHVHAYYRDVHHAVGGEDWMDEEMGVPQDIQDIWRFVTPGPLWVEKGRYDDTNTCYVIMEAECGWEQEHGLLLVWEDGRRLTKVGGFDGHWTNSNAYADDSLSDVVYAATDPRFTTRLD